MSKKDRIAIVISGIYFMFPLASGISHPGEVGMFVLFLPLLAYWGYRFIKNDISFLNVNERD